MWRRVAAPKPAEQDQNVFEISMPGPVTGGSVIHPPLSLTAAKELWIFWYGEEPDLTELVDPELLKSSGKYLEISTCMFVLKSVLGNLRKSSLKLIVQLIRIS